jgi:hypothetical protein
MRPSTVALVIKLVLTGFLLPACGSPPTTEPDSGAPGDDAGLTEPPPEDAGLEDAGLEDTSVADAEPPFAFNYEPTGASGSRLRRRYFEAAPLAYVSLDFWDNELEFSCKFERAPDGEWRCLPTKLDDVYFGDATCTAAVMFTTSDRCEDGYGQERYSEIFYRRSEAPSTATELYYKDNDGRCTRTYVDRTAWVAEPMVDSSFQRGAQSMRDRADGLAVVVIDGDDGSRTIVDVVDTARGTSCDFEFEPGRCVPDRRALASQFTNSACTTRIGESHSSNAPGILYVNVADAARCVTGHEYYEVGPRITPSEHFYMSSTGSCTPRTPSGSYTHYELAAPIPVTSLPSVDKNYEGSGELISARRYVDSAGRPLGATHVFWDSRNNVECRPVQFEDGSYRCLPTNAAWLYDEEFSGAGCTGESLGSYGCGAVGEYFYEGDFTCLIPRVQNVYSRGEPYGGSRYWFLTYDGTRCIEREQETYRFRYSVGTRAVPSEFPELHLRVE